MAIRSPSYRSNPSVIMLEKKSAQFKAIRNETQMAAILQTEINHLRLMHINPHYNTYEIPKKDGSFRLIEDPDKPLKYALRWLNHYLQAVYYFKRPKAVYGFCVSSRFEEDRNVVNNARRHIGNAYMLNIDLEDFFHTVTTQSVLTIFQSQFPVLNDTTTELLTGLSTYRGRLPMGSPASPVLSNFAALSMDDELEGFCKGASITYTRYADDMAFSSAKPISQPDINLLRDVISHHSFVINEEKVKHYAQGQTPSVTGLLIHENNIDLETGYLAQLETEINRLQTVMVVDQRYRTGMSYKKLKLLKQELNGKLNFARMVLGENHTDILRLYQLFDEAANPTQDFESASWLEIPYEF